MARFFNPPRTKADREQLGDEPPPRLKQPTTLEINDPWTWAQGLVEAANEMRAGRYSRGHATDNVVIVNGLITAVEYAGSKSPKPLEQHDDSGD